MLSYGSLSVFLNLDCSVVWLTDLFQLTGIFPGKMQCHKWKEDQTVEPAYSTLLFAKGMSCSRIMARHWVMKRLLTRADDFGASPGTNEAILGAIQGGLVRNVGIMAPAPWLESRLEHLRELGETVCLGLHATLTSEWAGMRWGPVAEAASVPGLVRPDGTFHENPDRMHCHGNPEEGVMEIRAQLQKLRSLGLEIRYLDCHMCYNWHPDWDRAMGNLAGENGLVYHAHGMLPTLRFPEGNPTRPDTGKVLRCMEADGVSTALWVFHPARRDPQSEKFYKDFAKPGTRVAESRHREYRFLTDCESVEPFLHSRELQLIRYDELDDQPDLKVACCLESK